MMAQNKSRMENKKNCSCCGGTIQGLCCNRNSVLWLGYDSLYDHRKPLLLLAFVVNVIAISCITMAAVAIQTSDKLTNVGWAVATTHLDDLPQCANTTNTIMDPSVSSSSLTVHAWLGLKGYYGQCSGQINGGTMSNPQNSTTQHSDAFCGSNNLGAEMSFASSIGNSTRNGENSNPIDSLITTPFDNMVDSTFGNNNNNNDDDNLQKDNLLCGNMEQKQRQKELSFLTCELITDAHSILTDYNVNQTIINSFNHPSCTACKDTSRNCIGTLLSAAAFGVFPLILTIRRYCSSKRDRGLRLRTLFFGGLAIVLGLHAFMQFHWQCVIAGMPSAFSVVVCSPSCNSGEPFLINAPMQFELYTGGKLVIVGAILKCAYFVLHFITPVVKMYQSIPESSKPEFFQDEEEGETSD